MVAWPHIPMASLFMAPNRVWEEPRTYGHAISRATRTRLRKHREDRDFADGDEGRRWIEVAPPGAANTIALVAPSEGTRGDPVPAQFFFHDPDGNRFPLVQPG